MMFLDCYSSRTFQGVNEFYRRLEGGFDPGIVRCLVIQIRNSGARGIDTEVNTHSFMPTKGKHVNGGSFNP